ncbi:hypothetical protein PsorP6_001899 [Peronosclerospora sorghi]|uniref:Uncharacterized protein n=1 Tax=Peronosclerospora sorghi TaxID=230839 RepID=A0ACC0WYM2_9STRA|nr:hypothetical protein PsorP6_001899 [Peronosclerospora sorghi]
MNEADHLASGVSFVERNRDNVEIIKTAIEDKPVESSSNANALKALFLSSAIRTAAPATWCISRKRTPLLTKYSAKSVVSISVTRKLLRMAEDKNKALSALAFEELSTLHPKFEQDVLEVWNFDFSVERKDVTGGTRNSSVNFVTVRGNRGQHARGYLQAV